MHVISLMLHMPYYMHTHTLSHTYTHTYIEGRLKRYILNILELSASGGRAMNQEVKRAVRRI